MPLSILLTHSTLWNELGFSLVALILDLLYQCTIEDIVDPQLIRLGIFAPVKLYVHGVLEVEDWDG
jgi:hypothetical protein